MALPMYVNLKSVPIDGWLDEDGEQVTSAVVVAAEAPAKAEKQDRLSKHRKMFESAWWASGAEEREDRPYLSRSGFIEYVVNNLGIKESSAKVYAKPSQDGRPISDLLVSEVIVAHEHGWIVIDDAQASTMMMRKNAL